MGTHTVEKIGGSSMSKTEEVLKNVLIGDRSGADLYDRIFVVSAYGGMTNKLLEHKKTGEPGVFALFAGAESQWAWSDAISSVGSEMQRINTEVFDDASDLESANAFVRDRIEGVRSCLIDLHRLCSYGHFRLDEHLMTVREMLSALGEAHSAYNTALLLQRRDVNARFVDLSGWRDDASPTLDERIKTAMDSIDLSSELPIVTGYAHCADGLMGAFDRGYSEVTFSRLAVLTGAREAIIHKEFHLSSADPRLVGKENVRTIGRTNYDVADQLSNMGMEAIHPSAAKGLRQAGIPLRIKNTFEPNDDGTIIDGDYVSDTPRVEIVTGLPSVFSLQFFDQDMTGKKGYDAKILEVLTRHRVRIVTKTSNANTITHFVDTSSKKLKRVVRDLEEFCPSAEVATRRVAIVSAIGSDLGVKHLPLTALQALSERGVEPLAMQDTMRNVDTLFVVDESDFETAVRALHARLVEQGSADVFPIEDVKAA